MCAGKPEEEVVVDHDENEEDSESESSYDSDDDDSSFNSDMEAEANQLMNALRQENEALRKAAAQSAARVKSPVEVWDEFIEGVETCTNASIKVTDEMVAWVSEKPEGSEERNKLTDKLCQDLVRASQAGFVVIHSILGRVFLSLLSPQQQEQVCQGILSKHAKTITFWKMGSDDSTDACGIPTLGLVQAMASVDWPNLTELEIRGLELETQDQLDLFLTFLKRAPKIRQFNLLGMVMSPTLIATSGLFDPIVGHCETIQGFDELQLCRTVTDSDDKEQAPSLISTSALEKLLSVKVKWWRMALDGMAFTDQHIRIIGAALKASDACKMNDLLSLQNNPQVQDWDSLYKICLYKQRMGLILSDDPSWVATFDMVRPLNNLHRRLEYIELDGNSGTYKYRSKEAWTEFLSVLGNLSWVGDARQVNYLWFALLEQPQLMYE